MDFILRILNHKWLLIAVVIFSAAWLFKQSDKYYGWTNPKNTFEGNNTTINIDGAGYYAYLPQFFLYQDQPHFRFLEGITQKYNHTQFISGIGYDYNTHKGFDKYYVGTAVLMSPVFLINHWLNLIQSKPSDGYSKDFQLVIIISSILYWLIGIIGLIRLLGEFNINNSIKILAILSVTFATNLNFFIVYYPSFSHVYSFTAIIWLFYITIKLSQEWTIKCIIILGLVVGLVFLIRPTNLIVVVFIPFILVGNQSLLNFLKIRYKDILIGIFVFLIVSFLQLYVTYLQVGKWAVNTYTAESFEYLFNPKWQEVLWSYRKGLFVYAPIFIWLIPSFIILFKTYQKIVLGTLFLFILWLYVTSSWWCWWYGGGLGMRPFIDFMGIYIFLIALTLNRLSFLSRGIYVLSLTGAIYLYQTNQIQFYKNIFHYDYMDKDDYWNTFLKTDNRFSWMLHIKNDKIKSSEIVSKKSFYLNQHTLKWESNKYSTKELLNLSYEIPDFETKIALPKNKNICFKFKGELEIGNPDSNPAFSLAFYQNGKEIGWKHNYAGMLIDRKFKMQKFQIDYLLEDRYKTCDSVRVIFSKGIPYTAVRNLSFQLLELKN